MKKIIRDKFRNLSCVACGKTPVDIAHIRSVGAGGVDEEWNLLAMCRGCHQTQHRVGWKRLTEKNTAVHTALNNKGWAFVDQQGVFKLWHPKLAK